MMEREALAERRFILRRMIRFLFFTGAEAPPPARAFADTEPRISTSAARYGRRRCLLLTVAMALMTALVPFAQSGRLLVLNQEDATLAIVDPASGKVLGTVPVGQGPHELVTSTDGK